MRKGLQKVLATALAAAMLCSFPLAASAARYIRGDINGDETVNVMDVVKLYRHVSGKQTLTAGQLAQADANGDGMVDSTDLMANWSVAVGQRSWTDTSLSTVAQYLQVPGLGCTLPEVQILDTFEKYNQHSLFLCSPQVTSFSETFFNTHSIVMICPPDISMRYEVRSVILNQDTLTVSLTSVSTQGYYKGVILLPVRKANVAGREIKVNRFGYTEQTEVKPTGAVQFTTTTSGSTFSGESGYRIVASEADCRSLEQTIDGQNQLAAFDEAFFEDNVLVMVAYTDIQLSESPRLDKLTVTDDSVFVALTEVGTTGLDVFTNSYSFVPLSRELYNNQKLVVYFLNGRNWLGS